MHDHSIMQSSLHAEGLKHAGMTFLSQLQLCSNELVLVSGYTQGRQSNHNETKKILLYVPVCIPSSIL